MGFRINHRVVLLIGTVVLIAAGPGLTPILADTVSAKQPPKDSPNQPPSQEAVLGKSTVLRADLAYGKDEKQRLDVYAPREAKRAPVIVFVHGGEWAKRDKAEVSYKPKLLNEKGMVFVSVNYRLSPPAKHPDHVNDIAAAVRWVRDHAGEFGGDPNKIVLMGQSAGCHLVTLVSLDPRYLTKVQMRPAGLRGVVAWSGGAYDLVEKVKGGGTYAPYIRQAFGDSEAAWRDASPVNHVQDTQPLPRFLFVSVEKGNASHQAAERLAGLIRSAKGQAASHLLEGRTHFTANHLLGAPGDQTAAVLLDFVQEATR
jgi:acetyl esterase/lipase